MAAREDDLASLLAQVGLTAERVRELARETGLVRRRSAKFDPFAWLCVFMALAVRGTVSHRDLAAGLDADAQCSLSRQAIALRITERCVRFVQRLLAHALAARRAGGAAPTARPPPGCQRILVQDSSLVQVPTKLLACCSGVGNAHAATAHVRVQAIHDLVSGDFLAFAIDPYSRNDQQAALLLRAQPGDLVLRDRGYLSADNLQAVVSAGAHLITRYKHRLTLYDDATGEPLPVLALLRQGGTLDRLVRLRPDHAPLRLVAAPVTEELANRRRQQLRRDTKGHHPSAELCELCGWTIYLTTLTDPAITLRQLLRLYGLRWRIEMLFKTWKSHLSFAKLHQVSYRQLQLLLTLRLLFATLLMSSLIPHLSAQLAGSGKFLALQKLSRYLVTNLGQLPKLLQPRLAPALHTALIRYCCYDQRQRRHYPQALQDLQDLLDSLNPALP